MSSLDSAPRFECRLNFTASCIAARQHRRRLSLSCCGPSPYAFMQTLEGGPARQCSQNGATVAHLDDFAQAVFDVRRQDLSCVSAELCDAGAVGYHLERHRLHKAHICTGSSRVSCALIGQHSAEMGRPATTRAAAAALCFWLDAAVSVLRSPYVDACVERQCKSRRTWACMRLPGQS